MHRSMITAFSLAVTLDPLRHTVSYGLHAKKPRLALQHTFYAPAKSRAVINSQTSALELLPDAHSPPHEDSITVSRSIAKQYSSQAGEGVSGAEEERVVDLLAIESAGRDVLAVGGYESVVDVDVTKGGIFDDDEDNNHLLSGVGFDALVDSPTLLENLTNDFGVSTTTHVQLAAIPRILDGRDVVMQSYTGTGKTLAFLLPILDQVDQSAAITQAMIVAPTRELAMQISRECDRLITNTDIRNLALIGGANPVRQVDKLRRDGVPHIVVGTPGRLAELSESGDLRVRKLAALVVDEVDQCLTGEFGVQVARLLRTVPKSTQKVLVSATGDVSLVRNFAGEHMNNPVLLRVGGALRVPQNISHWYCVVPARMKIETVKKVLFASPKPERAVVFVDDPRRADIVAERLWQMGVAVGALRGTAHKTDRKETLDAFRKGRVEVLVSTEIAARGLDVLQTTHVINLDLPTDADHYVHRAGRCGRAGKPGIVVSVTTPENAFVMHRMSKKIGVEVQRMEVHGGEFVQPVQRSSRPRLRNDKDNGVRGVEIRKESTRSDGTKATEEARPSQDNTSRSPEPKRGTKLTKKPRSKSSKKVKRKGSSSLKAMTPKNISEMAKKQGWVGNR